MSAGTAVAGALFATHALTANTNFMKHEKMEKEMKREMKNYKSGSKKVKPCNYKHKGKK